MHPEKMENTLYTQDPPVSPRLLSRVLEENTLLSFPAFTVLPSLAFLSPFSSFFFFFLSFLLLKSHCFLLEPPCSKPKTRRWPKKGTCGAAPLRDSPPLLSLAIFGDKIELNIVFTKPRRV